MAFSFNSAGKTSERAIVSLLLHTFRLQTIPKRLRIEIGKPYLKNACLHVLAGPLVILQSKTGMKKLMVSFMNPYRYLLTRSVMDCVPILMLFVNN